MKPVQKFLPWSLVLVCALATNAFADSGSVSEGAKQAGRELGSAVRQGGHALAQAGHELGSALRQAGHSIATAAKNGVHELKRAAH
ncbi:MAG: hypothetical protein ABSF50_05985 [Burkholderiaceae bacterium]|jgi:hypothetical protein